MEIFSEILLDSLRTSVLVCGLVVVMMMLIELVNVDSKGGLFSGLKTSKFGQVLLSATLGVIPGCMGGFASVSLYTHGIISFGALVAMMIVSSGDEAFVMLAMFPEKSMWIFALLFAIAVVVGVVVDLLYHPKRPCASCCEGLEVHKEDHEHSGHKRHFNWRRVVMFAGVSLFVVALLAGWLECAGCKACEACHAEGACAVCDAGHAKGACTVCDAGHAEGACAVCDAGHAEGACAECRTCADVHCCECGTQTGGNDCSGGHGGCIHGDALAAGGHGGCIHGDTLAAGGHGGCIHGDALAAEGHGGCIHGDALAAEGHGGCIHGDALAAGGHGGLTINLLSEEWMYWMFGVLSLAVLAVLIFGSDHFVDEHLWSHIVKKHVPSVFLWTFGVLVFTGVLLHYCDITSWISSNVALMIILAALIGIIPESGPHLIFVTLFASGVLPVEVLLTSCISQDGHSSLPLLAESKKDFLKAKAINFLVAVAVGFIVMLF